MRCTLYTHISFNFKTLNCIVRHCTKRVQAAGMYNNNYAGVSTLCVCMRLDIRIPCKIANASSTAMVFGVALRIFYLDLWQNSNFVVYTRKLIFILNPDRYHRAQFSYQILTEKQNIKFGIWTIEGILAIRSAGKRMKLVKFSFVCKVTTLFRGF